MRRSALLLSCFFPLSALSACSSASSTQAPAPPPTDPPAAAAPAPCDDGTYRNAATGACQAYPTLSVARSPVAITPVRDHHSTAILETPAGNWLYVLGGTDAWKTLHPDIQRAKIHDDGTLDAFEKVGSLPEPRAGQCMTRLGTTDTWLVAGGITQATGGHMAVSNTTLLVRFGADGSLGTITPGPNLPTAVMHLTCDATSGFVYAMGGRGANSKSTTMSTRAAIAPDGTLGAFEPQTPLTPDRSHHASFIRGKRLYLVGGLTGDPVGNNAVSHDDVVFAAIGDDGNIGDWQPAGKLPVALGVSSAQLYEDAVYTFGGLEGDDTFFSDAIRRATFNDDGTLTDFATLKTKLPDARGHVHDTPMWRSFLFSVGGQNDDGDSVGTVDVATFGG